MNALILYDKIHGVMLDATNLPYPTTDDIDTDSLIAYQDEYNKRVEAYKAAVKLFEVHADDREYARSNIGTRVDIVQLPTDDIKVARIIRPVGCKAALKIINKQKSNNGTR